MKKLIILIACLYGATSYGMEVSWDEKKKILDTHVEFVRMKLNWLQEDYPNGRISRAEYAGKLRELSDIIAKAKIMNSSMFPKIAQSIINREATIHKMLVDLNNKKADEDVQEIQ